MSESRFSLIRDSFLDELRQFVSEHPDFFQGMDEADARALGREAADGAVRQLLQEDSRG